MLQFKIPVTGKQGFTLNPIDGFGKPSKLFGIPKWQLAGGPFTISVAADGMSAFLNAPGVLDPNNTTTEVTVTADADPTPGVNVLTAQFEVVAGPDQATEIGVTAGDILPQ